MINISHSSELHDKRIIKLEKIFKKLDIFADSKNKSDKRDKSFAANNNDHMYNRD